MEKKTCKDCIHFKICNDYVYLIGREDKVACSDYKSTADVVPRSEYDAVVSAVDNSTNEFLKLHDAYQNQKREFEAELNKAKQEVPKRYMLKADGSLEMIPTVESVRTELAKQIFEEFEYLIWQFDTRPASDLKTEIAELKKKYIGD